MGHCWALAKVVVLDVFKQPVGHVQLSNPPYTYPPTIEANNTAYQRQHMTFYSMSVDIQS